MNVSISHTVKSGDTLGAIAKKYNADLNALIQSNKITDPNLIKPGQVISVPSPKYDQTIEVAKSELRRGKTWGDVWNKVKSQFATVEDQIIDKDLGTEWREPGAFEKLAKAVLPKLPPPFSEVTTKSTTPQFAPPKVELPIPKPLTTPVKGPTRPTVDPFATLIPQKPKQPEPPKAQAPAPTTTAPAKAKPLEAPPVLDITKSPWEQPEVPGIKVKPPKTPPVEEPTIGPASTFMSKFAPNAFELHKDKVEDKFKDPDWMKKTSPVIGAEIKVQSAPVVQTKNPTFNIKMPQWDVNTKTTTPSSKSPGEWNPDRQKSVDKTQQELSAYHANKPPYVPTQTKEFNDIIGERPFMSRIGSVFAEPPYETEEEKDKATSMIWMGIPTTSKDMLTPYKGTGTPETPILVMSPEEADRLKEFNDNLTINNRDLKAFTDFQKTLKDQGILFAKDENGNEYLDPVWSINQKQKELQDRIPKDIPIINEYSNHSNQLQEAFNEIAADAGNTIQKVYDFSLTESPKEISEKIKSNFQNVLDSAENRQYYEQSYHEQNEYNNVYDDSLKDQATAMAQFNELETKRKEVSTPDIEKFFQDANVWDSLSSVEQQALSNFYFLNQDAVDKLQKIAQEQQDVMSWMNANQTKMENAEKYGKSYDAATAAFTDTMFNMINSPEFEETISLMAAKTNNTKLAESYKKYYEAKKWLDEHDKEYIDAVAKLDSDKEIAALEYKNYTDTIISNKDKYFNLNNNLVESSKALRKTDLMNQMQIYKEQSDLATGLMGKSFQTAKLSDLVKPWKWAGNTIDLAKSIINLPSTIELWQQQGGITPSLIQQTGNIFMGSMESITDLIPKPVQEGMGWAYEKYYSEVIPTVLTAMHINTEAMYDYYNLLPKLIGQMALKGIEPDIAKQIISNSTDDQKVPAFADYIRRYINIPATEDLALMYDDVSLVDSPANPLLVKISKLQNFYAGRSATETFTTTDALTSLSDLVPKDQTDKLNEILALNDFAGKGMDITALPKGTKIVMPRWNQGPTMLNLLSPEARMKFESSHPAMYKVADELALLATDPVNYIWPSAMGGASKLARSIGKSTVLKSAITAVEKEAWGAKTLTGMRVANSFLKMIRFKLPDGRFIKAQPFDISPLKKVFSKAFLTTDGFKTVMKENFTDFTSLTRALINIKGISILKEMDNVMIRKLAMETEVGLDNVALMSQIKTVDALTRTLDEHNLGSEIIPELLDYKKPITKTNIRAAFTKKRIEDYQLPKEVISPKELNELKSLRKQKDLTVNEIMRKSELEQKEMSERILDETAETIKDTYDRIQVHGTIGKERMQEILRLYAENEIQDPNLPTSVLNAEEEILAWKFIEKLGLTPNTFYKMLNRYPTYEEFLRYVRKSIYEQPTKTSLFNKLMTSKYNALDTAGRNFYDDLINTQRKVWDTVVYSTKEQITKSFEEFKIGDQAKITYKGTTIAGKVTKITADKIYIKTKSGIDFEIKKDDINLVEHTPVRDQIETEKVYQDKLAELRKRYEDNPVLLQSLKEAEEVYQTYKGFTDSWFEVVNKVKEPIVASENIIFIPLESKVFEGLNKDNQAFLSDKKMELSVIQDDKVGVIYNVDKYKRTGTSGMLLDYNIKLAYSKLYELAQQGAGTIKVKEKITKGKEVTYQDVKGMAVNRIDLLHTEYFGKSETESGWLRTMYPDKDSQTYFRGLLENITKNPTEMKELGLTLKKTIADKNADQAVGQTTHLGKKTYINEEVVKGYPNIDVFYAVAIGLENLFEFNPTAYDKLFRQLDNLISNEGKRGGHATRDLTSIDRLTHELMKLAESRNLIKRDPAKMQLNFFPGKDLELVELLTRNKELSSTQIKRLKEQTNIWGRAYANNVYNKTVDISAKEYMRDQGSQDLVEAKRWAKSQKKISFETEEFEMPVNQATQDILEQSQLDSETLNALDKKYYSEVDTYGLDKISPKIDPYFVKTFVPKEKLLNVVDNLADEINRTVVETAEIWKDYKPGKTSDMQIMATDLLDKIIKSRVALPTKVIEINPKVAEDLFKQEVEVAKLSQDITSIRGGLKRIKIEDKDVDTNLLASIQQDSELLQTKIKEFEQNKSKALASEITDLQSKIELAETSSSIEELDLRLQLRKFAADLEDTSRPRPEEWRANILKQSEDVKAKLDDIEKVQALTSRGLFIAQKNIEATIESLKPYVKDIKKLSDLNDALVQEIKDLKFGKPTIKHSQQLIEIKKLISGFVKEMDSKRFKLEQDTITFAKENNLEYTPRFTYYKDKKWEINMEQSKSLDDLITIPESTRDILERIKYSTLEDGTPNPNYNKKWIVLDNDAEGRALIRYFQNPNNGFRAGKHYEIIHFDDPGKKPFTTKELRKQIDESGIDPIAWLYEEGGLLNIKDQDLIELMSLAYKDITTDLDTRILNATKDPRYVAFVLKLRDVLKKNPALKAKMDAEFKVFVEQTTKERNLMPEWKQEQLASEIKSNKITKSKTDESVTLENIDSSEDMDVIGQSANESALQINTTQKQIQEFNIEQRLRWLDTMNGFKQQLGWKDIVPAKQYEILPVVKGQPKVNDLWSIETDAVETVSRRQEFLIRKAGGNFVDIGGTIDPRLSKELATFNRNRETIVERNNKEIYKLNKEVDDIESTRLAFVNKAKTQIGYVENKLGQVYQDLESIKDPQQIQKLNLEKEILTNKIDRLQVNIKDYNKIAFDKDNVARTRIEKLSAEITGDTKSLKLMKDLELTNDKLIPAVIKEPIPTISKEQFTEMINDLRVIQPVEYLSPGIETLTIHSKDLIRAIALINELLDKTKDLKRYPAIVDTTGQLRKVIEELVRDKRLPKEANKIVILDDPKFQFNRIAESKHAWPEEYGANKLLKEAMIKYRKVYIFGFDSSKVTPQKFKDSFMTKALSQEEKEMLTVVYKAFEKAKQRTQIVKTPGKSYDLARFEEPVTTETVGLDKDGNRTFKTTTESVQRIAPPRTRDIAVETFFNNIDSSGAAKKVIQLEYDKMVNQDTVILCVSGPGTSLTESNRAALLEAINKKAKFAFPADPTDGEKAIREFLDINKAKIEKQDISVTKPMKGQVKPDMVFSPRLDLSGSRLELFKNWNEQRTISRIYRGSKELLQEHISELRKEVTAWAKDPFKFLPGFVRKEAPFTLTWFSGVEKLYSKAVAVPERAHIQKSWEQGIKTEIKNYRQDLELELDRLTNGHPEPWEKEALEAQINLIESVTKTLGDDIFKFDKPERWFEKIQNTIGRVLFESTLGKAQETLSDEDYKSLMSSIQDPSKDLAFDLIDKINQKVPIHRAANWIQRNFTRTMRISKDVNGALKKLWIWGVLFLRPGWALWNNLGDSLRAAIGARSISTFIDMQRAYIESTAQFVQSMVTDLSRFITDTSKPLAQRKYKVFTIDDYLTKANKNLYDEFFRTIGGKNSANAWMLKEGEHLTPAGELLDAETIKFITGNGLMMTNTDPAMFAAIMRKLKHDGILKDLGNSQSLIEQYALHSKGELNASWNRLKARGEIIKGHIENYNTHMEEMRRMVLMSDLIFKKGFTIAEAEITTKKWLFDYRDLNKAEQIARWFFPFYAYNAKIIGLYLDQCLKYGPAVWQAGNAFLDGIDKASEDLPDYYKERINLGGNIWFMPNFGLLDTVRLLRDPSHTVKEMIDNPARAPFGFSWNPMISSAIKLYTGKGYWDTGYGLKSFDGWWDTEIDKFKRTAEGKELNKSFTEDVMSVLFIYVPPLQFMENLLKIDVAAQVRDISWYESKQVQTIFKQFGLNYLVYDDIAKIWDSIYNLPPHLVQFYKDKLKSENPELWKYFGDYSALSKTAKIVEATGNEKLKLQQDFFINYVKDQYYDMEEKMKGSGQQWIDRDPTRKKIMEDYWNLHKTPGIKSIGERIYEVGSLKSTIRELLGGLKSVDATRIAKMNAVGIEHPFSKPFDETALRNEIYDEHGNLKIQNMDQLMNILQKYNVVKDINDLQELAKSAAVTYQDWKDLANKAKEAKQDEDALYYTRMGTLMGIIPENIDQMSEVEAAKYWKEWNKLRQLLIFDNPKFKERYMSDLPKWQLELYDKNAEYIQRWDNIINDKDDDKYDYFENFYAQPTWFQKWYFLKHPEAAISYPVRNEYLKIFSEMKPEVFDADIIRHAYDYMYAHQAALKAWDQDRPGIANYIEKMREVWKKADDEDTRDYFERFYQNPTDKSWNDFREFYFSKQGNEYKKITYPFIQKWIELIEIDKKNEKLDKPTYFAEEWFWSPKNTEARDLYGKNKPIDKDHTAIDYQARWREINQTTRKDQSKFAELVLGSEPWFQDAYFKKYPERKLYYPLMQKMQGAGFDESNKIFFAPENKAAREAWEKDKPGTTAYRTFWQDMSKIKTEKGNQVYYDFYFSDENKEFRAKHELNSPGANEAFKLSQQYSQLDSDSWEDRKAKRQFVKDNPKLADWWARNKTEQDIVMTLKANAYYDIKDSIEANGSGRAYLVDYYTKTAQAEQYLKDNPDLQAYWDSQKKTQTGPQSVISKLLEEYSKLSIEGDRAEFIKKNPDLEQYFLNSVPPGIRKLRLLNKMYWDLKTSQQKSAFLQAYPALTEYWEVKSLPTSFFADYDKFRPYQDMLNSTRSYFKAVKAHNWNLAETLRKQFPDTPNTSTPEGRWLLGKLYNEAMTAWAATFGSTMSTYFFRSLPGYIRNEYFRRHPDSKMFSYFPIGRILEEGMRMEDSQHPDLAWAYLQQRKYGKNIPFNIDKQVKEIMLKYHVWEDRTNWSQARWAQWWAERTAKTNNLLQQDLENIPLLRMELQRIIKTYSRATLPRPFKKTRGMLNPFFGGSHIVLD